MEIRAASIHAVELIKEKVKLLFANAPTKNESPGKGDESTLSANYVNSVMIDHFLWDYRRENVEEMDKFPFHKVRCIYY